MGGLANVWEVPPISEIFQGAIEVPRPTVKGAVKRLPVSRAFLAQQPCAAVGATVNKRCDLTFRDARDDHRRGADVVNVMVADFWDVPFTARPLLGP